MDFRLRQKGITYEGKLKKDTRFIRLISDKTGSFCRFSICNCRHAGLEYRQTVIRQP